MPDNFFRIFLYGAATVALGAGVIVLADKFVSKETGNNAYAAAAPAENALPRSADVKAQQPEWKSDSFVSAEPLEPAGADRVSHTHVRSSQVHSGAAHAAGPVHNGGRTPAREPMISYSGNAVELVVPVHPRSGQQAHIPLALALAANPAGLPEAVRQDAQRMAADFLDNVGNVAAAAGSAMDAGYYNRWESAAFLSDRDFKMRYGRTAYVRMNQLAAQEAAAGLH